MWMWTSTLLGAALLTVAVSKASGQGGQQRRRKAARQPHLSDRLFTDNLLLEQSAVSKSYCAALCARTDSCATFTYTTATSQRGVCRGHSTWMTSNSPNVRSEGTAVYSFVETAAWLYGACGMTDADCALTNTVCFSGKCLCTPGFYYSVSLNLCIDACDTWDPQTYLHYPASGITGHNMDGFQLYDTVEKCQAWCGASPQCQNFERRLSDSRCLFHTVTARDHPTDWDTASTNWDFYQKNCA